MLTNLSIQNYALIRELTLEPKHHFITITGETGAGKSIMIGAIGLLLGNRADKKSLYDSSKKCVVEGTFDLREHRLEAFFEEHDLDYEAQTVIRREITPSGKSRAFINDTPATLDVVKALGAYLMDIHSQHETLQLSGSAYQLELVDHFAGNSTYLKNYKHQYALYRQAEQAHQKLRKESIDLQKDLDYNQYLYDELQTLDLSDGEQEELEQELHTLEHAEEIKGKLHEILELFEAPGHGVADALYHTQTLIHQAAHLSKPLQPMVPRLESARLELKDWIQELADHEQTTEHDPQRIEQVNERLSRIYQLQKKHQVATVAALLDIQQQLHHTLDRAHNFDEELKAAEALVEEEKAKALDLAQQLSASRHEVMDQMSAQIKDILSNLGMPDARIEMKSQATPLQEQGIDDVELLFSANKGIAPQALKQVASGGEFSRLMFAVKYIMAGKMALPTIIFDEIDTGVSGEVAIKLGKMMGHMAAKHQVVVITHLPQIAAKGGQHYFVFKADYQGKAVSQVRELSQQERLQEIAKMIGGDKPSSGALESAREMLNAG